MKLSVVEIAKVWHGVNRAYCESIGDFSQKPWDKADSWQHDSAVVGVSSHMNDPNLTPEDSHKLWMNHKVSQGWVYGPVKDVEKKEHPCMVEYKNLPQGQRSKDYIFVAIVRELS